YSAHLFPLASELNRFRSCSWSGRWCAAAYSGQDIDPPPAINVVWRSGASTRGGGDMNSRVIQGCPAWVDLVLQTRNGRPEQRNRASNMRSCHGSAGAKRICVIGTVTGRTRVSARSSDVRFYPAASIDSNGTAAAKGSNAIGADV